MKIKIELSELEAECFRIIRRETCDFHRESGDAELGSFVRGVIEVEKFLYDRGDMETISNPCSMASGINEDK